MVDEIESGTSEARSDQSSVSELQFVNDWSELEEALAYFKRNEYIDTEDYYWDQGVDPDLFGYVQVIVDYVPRLLTQYANLVELSFALTEGCEQLVALTPKAGLYLPDHR